MKIDVCFNITQQRLEKDPDINGQLIFDKDPKETQWWTDSSPFSTYCAGTT